MTTSGLIPNIFWLGSLLLLLMACQPDEKPTVVNPPIINPSFAEGPIDLLIFKEEQKLEFWNTSTKEIITTIKLNDTFSLLPIGYFHIQDFDTKALKLDLTSEFYESKNYSLSDYKNHFTFSPTQVQSLDLRKVSNVIIFPSDDRTGQAFKPCLACPHWIAELYGQLTITLNQYLNRNLSLL